MMKNIYEFVGRGRKMVRAGSYNEALYALMSDGNIERGAFLLPSNGNGKNCRRVCKFSERFANSNCEVIGQLKILQYKARVDEFNALVMA